MAFFKIFNSEWSLVNHIQNNGKDDDKIISQTDQLEQEEEQSNEMKLQSEIETLNKTKKELCGMIAEYDSILTKVQNECYIHKEINEKNDQYIANLVIDVNDIYMKYEQAKLAIEDFKQNQTQLENYIEANEEIIMKLQNKYNQLKKMSKEKLQEANKTFHTITIQHEDDLNRLKTKIKKLELTNEMLQQNLKQKQFENDKLLQICNEFIENK